MAMKRIYFLLFIVCFLLLSGCSTTSTARLVTPPNIGDTREAVLQADRNFSKMSEEKGMNTAFIAYAAPNAVLLRPKIMPIESRDQIRMYMSKNSEQNTRLTWSPMYAEIAASGDMAYTYGTYLLETLDIDGKPVTAEGTYVSVWQKDVNGFWRFVLESGNPGLHP